MQNLTVSEQDAGKHLVRFLTQKYPNTPVYIFQKALKNKEIQVDGKRVRQDIPLEAGTEIRIYLSDDKLNRAARKENEEPSYEVIYADKNALIVNKPQGLTVHPGESTPPGSTLIERLRAETGNNDLTLCHRLDRNTGGLVLLAQNKVSVGKLNEALQEQQIVKRYRCLVRGIPEVGTQVLLSDGDLMLETKAYWERPSQSDLVYVHTEPREHDLPMITRYRVLRVFTDLCPDSPISELEVELVTGRTHQIRAHFAFLGHPLLGDGKYGRNAFNLQFRTKSGGKLRYQQLFATSLLFGPDLPSGLESLRRKTFTIQPDYGIDLRPGRGE